MSASKKSGSCKQCNPCSKSKSGKKSLSSTRARGSGTGNGSGSLRCPGSSGSSSGLGGDIADDMDCNFSADCKDDIAKKINEKVCAALGNPWFGDVCYECNNLQVTAAGKCKCGVFEGDIIISPGDLATSCGEVDCS